LAISTSGDATLLEKGNAQVKIKDQQMGFEKIIYVQGKNHL
jgi:hypothetical protein